MHHNFEFNEEGVAIYTDGMSDIRDESLLGKAIGVATGGAIKQPRI